MTTGNVFTYGSLTTQATWSMNIVTFVDVNTSSSDVGWIKCESLITHTGSLFPSMYLAVAVDSTGYSVAWGFASGVRITDESFVTCTRVTAIRVGTFGIWSAAWFDQAFIDVLALWCYGIFNLFESVLAFTFITAFTIVTFGIRSTDVSSFTFIHICLICKTSHQSGILRRLYSKQIWVVVRRILDFHAKYDHESRVRRFMSTNCPKIER